jgi:DNA-binding response OmpR family regulator
MPSQPLKILIVDDDRSVARALARALSDHRTVIESDPVAAMRRISEGQWFDVVVSDKRMPGMDGLELLASARKLPDPPIFVLISGDDALDATDADATVAKPFATADLLALITTLSTRRAVATTQPIPRPRLPPRR